MEQTKGKTNWPGLARFLIALALFAGWIVLILNYTAGREMVIALTLTALVFAGGYFGLLFRVWRHV